MLEEFRAMSQRDPLAPAVRELLRDPLDGRAKLWTVWRALQCRREYERLFRQSEYLAVQARGAAARHALAFARRADDGGVLVATGRLYASLAPRAGELPLGAEVWGDAALDVRFLPADTRLTNVLTGETLAPQDGAIPLAALFAHFNAALLCWR